MAKNFTKLKYKRYDRGEASMILRKANIKYLNKKKNKWEIL